MQTCKTCRHWDRNFAFETGERGYCLGAPHVYDRSPVGLSMADLAVLYATESNAWLLTLGEFGCVLHEPAPETVQEDDGA